MYAVQTALDNPGCNVLYIALTRESARKIFWKDIIKVLDKEHNLKLRLHNVHLTATFPNGSVIHLVGADAKADEMEKFLGAKYKLVIIDEGASFRQDLRKMCYQVIWPALADEQGTLCLVGTPGDVTKGLFFDVTTGQEKERKWSVHKWSTLDNPYMAENWKKDLDDLITNNPRIVETPAFKRMYLAEWVIDTDKLVYKLQEDSMVQYVKDEFKHYVMGVDLGYNDASAFVILGYTQDRLYVVEAYKQEKMLIKDVAERIKYYQRRYNFDAIITDPASKQVVEELRQRYDIPLKSAEKTDKFSFIDLLNSDLILNKLQIFDTGADSLLEEMRSLVYDERSSKRAEHPNCENHLCDAMLYAWRYCYNYAWTPTESKAKASSEEYIEKYWEKESEKMENSQEAEWWQS